MYVERALYLGRKKKRTSLLTLKVASIECMVFSDASMSGRNRLVEFMQQVNRRDLHLVFKNVFSQNRILLSLQIFLRYIWR